MGDGNHEAKEDPILTSFDNNTGGLNVFVVKRKGVVPWVTRAIDSELEFMGYRGCRISVKSYHEQAILAVKRSVAELRSAPTSMIESPARESMCNGKMEKAFQNIQGQLRTLQLALEENIGVKIDVKSQIIAWLCTWACTSLNRYHIGVDGLTAFTRATGTQCARPIAEIREQVMWKKSVKRSPAKAETLWEEGTFRGLKGRTSGVFVADRHGKVHKCRTIRARADDERWNADRVGKVTDSVAQRLY